MWKLRFASAMAAGVMACAAWAADAPFVGEWKMNPSQTRLTDQMKLESDGGNRYTFDVGGGPETVAADGTDQPGYAGTTVAVTLTGPDSLTFVRKKDGRMLLTADWTLSKDGSTLNDDFTSFAPDGSASNVKLAFKRTSATSGLIGSWEGAGATVNFSLTLKIQPYGKDGLSILSSASDRPKELRFDGKDYPNLASNALAGSTYAARRLDDGTVEITDKVKGQTFDVQRYALSADHKTLTLTIRKPGVRTPNVFVFDRQ